MAAAESEFLLSSKSSVINTSTLVYKYFNTLAGTSSIICALVVLTLLIVVVCVYKAYKTTLQRLVLYHIIFSLFCELSQFSFTLLHLSDHAWICRTFSYVCLYLILLWSTYTSVVTNCLFVFAICLTRGSTRFLRHGKVAEFVCILLTVIIPLTYVWIPLRDESYISATCGNLSTLSSKGYKVGLVVNTVGVVFGLEIVLVCIAMCSLFCFLRRRLRNSQLTNLLKNLLYYTVSNTILVTCAALLAVGCYYLYLKHLLETLTSIVALLSGVVMPFLVLMSTLVLLPLAVRSEGCRCVTVCNKFCFKARCRRQQADLNANESQNEQTNPSSHPMNQPSHTYFSIPYTGEFTQVSVNDRNEDEGERTPLINDNP